MTDELRFSAPASETSFAKESKSLEGLIAKIEELFDCRDGPYQAWVEYEGERLAYVTLGWITEGLQDDPDSAFEKLRNALLHQLLTIREALKREKPILFWRYAPEARMLEDSERDHGKVKYKIYTRVAIPGADWSLIETKPEGAPFPRIQ